MKDNKVLTSVLLRKETRAKIKALMGKKNMTFTKILEKIFNNKNVCSLLED